MCTSARNVIIPPPHPPQTSCKAFNMCTSARNVIIPPPHPPHPQPKKPKNLRGRSGTRQHKQNQYIGDLAFWQRYACRVDMKWHQDIKQFPLATPIWDCIVSNILPHENSEVQTVLNPQCVQEKQHPQSSASSFKVSLRQEDQRDGRGCFEGRGVLRSSDSFNWTSASEITSFKKKASPMARHCKAQTQEVESAPTAPAL